MKAAIRVVASVAISSAGGPAEAAKAGRPVSFIAEHGRWSKTSPQVLEYIRPVDKWRDNPMRGIGL